MQQKKFDDNDIERYVKENEGLRVAKLAKFLGVDGSSLETRLRDVVNVYCDDKGRLYFHRWK